jgi:hypothetical protein
MLLSAGPALLLNIVEGQKFQRCGFAKPVA